MPALSYDIDASYSDSVDDPSLQLHQSHHDALHNTLRSVSIVWSGATIVDLGQGNIRVATLAGNVTSFTISGLVIGAVNSLELVLIQGSGGSKTMTWPVGTLWASGLAPALSTTVDARDRVLLTTYDNGGSWYGDLIGKDYR